MSRHDLPGDVVAARSLARSLARPPAFRVPDAPAAAMGGLVFLRDAPHVSIPQV